MNQTIIYSGILFVFIIQISYCENIDCTPYIKMSGSTSFFSRLFQKRKINLNYYKETKFHLLTRYNLDCTQELFINDVNRLRNSNFNLSQPVRILIHGWKNNLYSNFNKLLKTAYLKRDNFNVIIVDWSNIANDPNYTRASFAVRYIGRIVAEFTQFLSNKFRVPFDSMYLIGHSLGAQISGVAGYYVKPHNKFNTIYALDPAEPNFDSSLDLKYQIDSSDASYVESIHTDMSLFGQQRPIGHSAFFPAYGKIQPGCRTVISGCSHSRAYIYLAESINSRENFWGIKCKNMKEINESMCSFNGEFAKMGGEPSTKKYGIYYVPVKSSEPFAINLVKKSLIDI